MKLTIDNWMVAWNFAREQDGSQFEVMVGPWPDKTGWSRKYRYTSGCCYTNRREMTVAGKVAMMFIDFHSIIIKYGIDPHYAHDEFLKIDQYRARISEDCRGADQDPPVELFNGDGFLKTNRK